MYGKQLLDSDKSADNVRDCNEQELVEDVLEVACNTGLNMCAMLVDLRRGSR